MITFDNIEKFSKRYHCYNYFLRFFHDHLYYRKYYVINKENVPPKGEPVMVIANHQNGLMDALAILYLFEDDRQPVFIARGDIFKKDWIAKILRFLKILPTFRNRDGGVGDIKRNNITFEHAARILRKGGTLVMFPEAGHQAGHFMSTFKKGFPRIAFAAEEENDFKLGLKILPLNIHYSDYFNCRSKLMVTVGKPFTFQEFFEQYTTDPNLAYLALNEKARAAVKALTPDIEFPEYYPEMELLRQMLCKPRLKAKGIDPDYFPNQKPEEVILIQELTEMKENDSENFLRLMNITKEYRQGLEQYNLR
ncbi:MAG: 1-acyl-sn-glycerol-3-phosphate acyltransferase, partial [Bacteroidales bacterium]